jgi:hypothetical protein
MMTDVQIAGATSRLRDAFRPLRCKAEDRDYRAKLQFKVIDENDNIIFESTITDHDVNDANRFADVIEHARAAVQAKGYVVA